MNHRRILRYVHATFSYGVNNAIIDRHGIACNLWALTSVALKENYRDDLFRDISNLTTSVSWKNTEVQHETINVTIMEN